MFKIDDETVDDVLQKFSKKKESVYEDVGVVKRWIEEQPHLPDLLDTRSIINFLILTKFSIENTKRKIDLYYTARSQMCEIYQDINPKFSDMKEAFDAWYAVPHPQLVDYNRVFFYRIKDEDLVKKMEPQQLLRWLINVNELRLRKDVMYGEIIVIDCDKIPLSFYLKLTPSFVYKILVVICEKVFSFRMKELYAVNCPPIARKIEALVKKVMKPKIFERIHLFCDNSVLKNKFSEDFLPEEFGGSGPSVEKLQEMLKEELDQNQELFDSLDQVKVDEGLRPPDLKNNEILGYYGNFKQLDVD